MTRCAREALSNMQAGKLEQIKHSDILCSKSDQQRHSQAMWVSFNMHGSQLLVATMTGRLAIAFSGCLRSHRQTMAEETSKQGVLHQAMCRIMGNGLKMQAPQFKCRSYKLFPSGCVRQHVNAYWSTSEASDPASHASTNDRPYTWCIGATCPGRQL